MIDPDWKSRPLKTASKDYRDNLAEIPTYQKKDIISNFLKASYYSKSDGTIYKEIPWYKLSVKDITGWPIEEGVPFSILKDLNPDQLTKIIRNLDKIELQPSFIDKIAKPGKRKRVD